MLPDDVTSSRNVRRGLQVTLDPPTSWSGWLSHPLRVERTPTARVRLCMVSIPATGLYLLSHRYPRFQPQCRGWAPHQVRGHLAFSSFLFLKIKDDIILWRFLLSYFKYRMWRGVILYQDIWYWEIWVWNTIHICLIDLFLIKVVHCLR